MFKFIANYRYSKIGQIIQILMHWYISKEFFFKYNLANSFIIRYRYSKNITTMAEKEFRLDPDSELRFEVESKKDTVDLKVSFYL